MLRYTVAELPEPVNDILLCRRGRQDAHLQAKMLREGKMSTLVTFPNNQESQDLARKSFFKVLKVLILTSYP